VHAFAVQGSTTVKEPSVPQVESPPPEKPALHITVIISPVTPVMDPMSDLSEVATSVAEHSFGVQAVPTKAPFVPHVHSPPPEYPGEHTTMAISVVMPLMEACSALFEL
jgi:hypothetical protein